MAKVLSSISGNLISAASAGYAPTNSGDVSAIASAYQVVSATGTQLYAGTAHVTSINSTPISASRAGNAANASMANSAYYDGTGRLISALPDSAAVSSIASSYATSKQDASGMSAYAKSANVSGTVNTVVNNSANWNSVYNTVSSNSASWSGSTVSSPSGTIFVSGDKIEGTNSAVLTASSEQGFTTSFAAGDFIPSWQTTSLYAGTLPGSGATLYIPINGGGTGSVTAIISGKDSNMAIVTASGLASANPFTVYLGAIVNTISASANTYIPINGDLTAEKTGGITVTGIGELAWKSAVDNVTNTVSSNSATWGQGGVDSATVSAIASGYASGKADSSALSSYALSADVSSTIDTVSSNSASWATVTGKLDSSASSSFYTTANESGYIGSAYVESSISAYQPLSGMSAYESSFSAGVGLEFVQSGADRILQVDTPVDIVAGPGIVIDNPDGNTLRVSMAANYETMLWSGSATTANFPLTLNESFTNFESVKFYWRAFNYPAANYVVSEKMVYTANDYYTLGGLIYNTSTSAYYNVGHCLKQSSNSLSYIDGKFVRWGQTNVGDATPFIAMYKIVGINRTASN